MTAERTRWGAIGRKPETKVNLMAKGQNRTRHQDGIVKRYYEHRDTIALQNVSEIASDLFLCDNPKKEARLWERAAKALTHTGVDAQQFERIVADRDIEGMTRLINQLTIPTRSSTGPRTPDGPNTASPPPATASTPQTPVLETASAPTSEPSVAPPDAVTLKRALKAFRKRLKLTRLDEESKLGVGPLTSGARSSVVAITPPNQFPPAVWEKLIEQGKLKRSGTGFYALAKE